jgi:exopolyphosphatase/guanosine-5'-triphosphate,3'-diphosphate pyrophosphatase
MVFLTTNTTAMSSPNTTDRIAAIDVGTNSFHMVIASVTEAGMLRIHARSKDTVRLGSSKGDMKRISDDAMERGLRAMVRLVDEARQHNATVRAIATSAVREALNKDVFVDRVLSQTGVHIDVIPGIEEGRLIFLGVRNALSIADKRVFVFDIGGGSTETITGHDGEPVYIHSAKLGHIRLSERFFPDSRVNEQQIADCRAWIRGEWQPAFQSHIAFGFDEAIACSGTVMALASIAFARSGRRTPETLNGVTLDRDEILGAIDMVLSARTIDERMALPGLDAKRADVIVAGALLVEHLIKGLGIRRLTLSGYALREGIVFDTFQQARDIGLTHHLSRLRYQSVLHICELYRVNRRHAEHVKHLCVRMFDDLMPLHGMGDKERELLEAAALLHDVGYHIAADQHHKHSEYIIRNCVMPGFTSDETVLISSVARYHRKSHPKKKHPVFAGLTSSEQHMVGVLASILRIAEGLDRRQQSVVHGLEVRTAEAGIEIGLKVLGEMPDVELWSAERRTGLMEEIFRRPVRFSVNRL